MPPRRTRSQVAASPEEGRVPAGEQLSIGGPAIEEQLSGGTPATEEQRGGAEPAAAGPTTGAAPLDAGSFRAMFGQWIAELIQGGSAVRVPPAALPVDPPAADQIRNDPAWPLNRFMQLRPPPFHGTTDPLEAEQWISDIREMLTAFRCQEEEMVTFASFLLRGEAKMWWNATKRLLPAMTDGEFITWEAFADAFEQKYIPCSFRVQMSREFTHLVQGDMSVAQYEERFNTLSRFATDMAMTDRKRAELFNEGLDIEIRGRVNMAGDLTYAQLVEKARVAEKDWLEAITRGRAFPRPQRSVGGQQGGRPGDGQASVYRQRFHPYARAARGSRGARSESGPSRSASAAPSGPSRTPSSGPRTMAGSAVASNASGAPRPPVGRACFTCGRTGHLARDCPGTQAPSGKTCYHCGEVGHIRPQCPLRASEAATPVTPGTSAVSGTSGASTVATRGRGGGRAGQPGRGRGGGGRTGRVFAMTERDAEASNDVATGMEG